MEMEDDGVEVTGCDEEEEEEEDIYGDLEADIFWGPPSKRSKEDDVVNNEQYQALLKENQELKVLVKKLQRENKHYSDNMSSLYLTAKNEVDKKNFIIKNLSEKLKKVSQSKSNLTTEDAEGIFRNCQEALVESQDTLTLNEISNKLRKVPEHRTKNKRKHIKFGNMSYYFFREQGCFERGESVDFPKPKKADKNIEGQSESISVEKPATDLKSECEEKDCAGASKDNGSSGDRPSKSYCDNDDKVIPEGKEDIPPTQTRPKTSDENLNNREHHRISEHHSLKRHHSPSSSAPDRYSNRKADYSSRSKEHVTRPGDYHSRGRKNHRSDDYRSRRRTARQSTNDYKNHDGKRHSQRSRSRSR